MTARPLLEADRPPAEPDRPSGLVDIVRLIRRHRLVITLVPLAVVALTVVVQLALPREYRAMATLLVVPSTFSSTLKPPEFSVQGYQRILESDGVVLETLDRLIDAEVMSESDVPKIGNELTSRIFLSRTGQEKSLAPVLEVIAKADTPEKAATIANTWAEVFLEHTHKLVRTSLAPSLRLIETHFEQQRERVAGLEGQRVSANAEYRDKIDSRIDSWDQRLVTEQAKWAQRTADHRRETEDIVSAFQEETRQIMGETAASIFVGGDGAGGLSSLEPTQASELRQLAALRTHLAQTPATIALDKAISDDALWLSKSVGDEKILSETLVTEEQNPVYQDLSKQVSLSETRVFGVMGPEHQDLLDSLDRLESVQRSRSAGLAKLQIERAQGLEELRQRKEFELRRVTRGREKDEAELEMELENRLLAIDRDLESGRLLLAELAENRNQGTLAEGEGSLADVQIGSRALPPLRPEPRGLALKALMSLILGTVLGLAIAGAIEASQRVRFENGL